MVARAPGAQFPNLEVMARQYLGCPATSATVERLFSKVGVAFSDKRKSSEAKCKDAREHRVRASQFAL